MACRRDPSLGVGMKQVRDERDLAPTVVPMKDVKPHSHLTVEQIEDMVRAKIGTSTRNFTVQKQRMYQLFGRPTQGISRAQFRRRLQNWGIMPDREQLDGIFNKWDADGNGKIDFNEFMAQMVAKDYVEDASGGNGDDAGDGGGRHGNQDGGESSSRGRCAGDMYRGFSEPASTTFNDVMLAAVGQRRVSRPDEITMYANIDAARQKAGTLDGGGGGATGTKFDLDAVEGMIRDKIQAHSRGDNVEKASSYALFGRPERGISKRAFKFKLNQWGVHMHPRALAALFNKYDADGSGRIDFLEFMKVFGGEGTPHPLSYGEVEYEKAVSGAKSDRKNSRAGKHKPKPKRPRHLRNNASDADGLFGGAPGGGNRNPFGGGGPDSRVKAGGVGGEAGKAGRAAAAAAAAAGVAAEAQRSRSRDRRRAPRTVRYAQRKVWQAAEALALAEAAGAAQGDKREARALLQRKLAQYGSGDAGSGPGGRKGRGSRRQSRVAGVPPAPSNVSLDARGLDNLLEKGLGLRLPYYQRMRLRDHYGGGDVAGSRLIEEAEAIAALGSGRAALARASSGSASGGATAASSRPPATAMGTSRSRQAAARASQWQLNRLASAAGATATAQRVLRGAGGARSGAPRPSTSAGAVNGDAVEAAVAASPQRLPQLKPRPASVRSRQDRASARRALDAKLA